MRMILNCMGLKRKKNLEHGYGDVTKMSLEKVCKMVSQIEDLSYLIGKEIQNAPDEKMADALYHYVWKELGFKFAESIWDYYVDWDSVTWK